MRSLELRIPPVVIVVVLGAAMAGIARLLPGLGFPLPAGRIVGGLLIVTGVAVALLGVISFRRAGTTVNPMQPGAASQLVVSGIYRVTRNPMYLGMLLVLLGWGVLLANAAALAAAGFFVPVMNRLQVLPEEKILAANFGSAFTAYQATVRRWL